MKTIQILMMMLLLLGGSALTAQESFDEAGAARPHQLRLMAKIEPTPDRPGFARYTAPLGDINGDGYGDLAVSTFGDTTFIYLGWRPFINTEPHYFVLGGAQGVAAGDFNGDGLTDIATAAKRWFVPEDNGYTGLIRIYLHTGGDPPYRDEPDRIIRGEPRSSTAYSISPGRPALQAADLTGDGAHELLFTSSYYDSTWRMTKLNMLRGGPDVLSADLHDFTVTSRGHRDYYADHFLCGDVNGDGCDDLLVWGSGESGGEREYYIELYFGNRDGVFGAPDVVSGWRDTWINGRKTWYFGVTSTLVDLDGDGCDDLVSGSNMAASCGVPVAFGRPDITGFAPDDSIPNPYPAVLIGMGIAMRIGDVNGDGYDDLALAWSSPHFPYSVAFRIHPGGPGWRTPTGELAMNLWDTMLHGRLFPAGDVNGDGLQDVLMYRYPTNLNPSKYQRLWLYSGARAMLSDAVPPATPAAWRLHAFPHPARSGESATLRLEAEPGVRGVLRLLDLLGREAARREVELLDGHASLPLAGASLLPGVYFAFFHSSDGRVVSTPVVVIR